MIASTMANRWRGKNERAYRVEDFMPQFGRVVQRRSPEDIEAMLMQWARTHNKFVAKQRSKGQG